MNYPSKSSVYSSESNIN